MPVIKFSYGDSMSTPLDSDLLRTFLAVADTGNLTRAADTVRRTQSAVSMQIRKLEELIGSALFERHSRGVILTDDGRRLADNARRIVSLLDDTAAAMRSPALEGSVRIGISEEYVNSTLPKALGAFAAIHPGVEVTVRQETSMANSAALAAGELDIAVVFEPGGRSRNEVLMVNPTVWATCDQHGAHERRPVPIATYTYAEGGWCDELARRSLQSRGIEFSHRICEPHERRPHRRPHFGPCHRTLVANRHTGGVQGTYRGGRLRHHRHDQCRAADEAREPVADGRRDGGCHPPSVPGTGREGKGRSAIHDDRWMIYDPGYLLGRWAPYARTHGSGQGQSP